MPRAEVVIKVIILVATAMFYSFVYPVLYARHIHAFATDGTFFHIREVHIPTHVLCTSLASSLSHSSHASFLVGMLGSDIKLPQ